MKPFLILAAACAASPLLQVPLQLAQQYAKHPVGDSKPLDGSVASEGPDFDGFEEWVTQQSRFAFSQILQNMGGSASMPSVPQGVVVASPSKSHPDYYYNWIRDSALTIRSLIYELRDAHSSHPEDLKAAVESYIKVNHQLQRLPNRSGTFADRSGLGEPKFMVDMTVFSGSWGRPQSDGPALRVSTIANYLSYLAETDQELGPGLNSSFIYTEIVRPDLEYVMAKWHAPSFDLWEEVHGMHFFTVLVQSRALNDGARMAEQMGDGDFARQLKAEFGHINEYIASAGFVGPLHIIETPSFLERDGLDAATLLAALHAHNMDFGHTESVPFDVDDRHILNTIAAMVVIMKRLYPINSGSSIGLGRYPEDVYNGDGTSEGNPWFICTASAAEVLYKMVYKKQAQKADLDPANLGPFMKLLGMESGAMISHGSSEWAQFMDSSVALADSFLRTMRVHIDSKGHMSEQFNKYTGFMQGAADLTWSYSSFYNCVRWRKAVKA